MAEISGWIRAKAIPIATVEAGSGYGDLDRVHGIIGEARFVSPYRKRLVQAGSATSSSSLVRVSRVGSVMSANV